MYNSKNFKNIKTYLIPLILWLLLFTDGIKVVRRAAMRSSIWPQSSLESSLCRVFIRMFNWHSKMCCNCITKEGVYKVTPFFYLDFLSPKISLPLLIFFPTAIILKGRIFSWHSKCAVQKAGVYIWIFFPDPIFKILIFFPETFVHYPPLYSSRQS